MKSPFDYLSIRSQSVLLLTTFGFVFMLSQLGFYGLLVSKFGSAETVNSVLTGEVQGEDAFIYVLWTNAFVQLFLALTTFVIGRYFFTKLAMKQWLVPGNPRFWMWAVAVLLAFLPLTYFLNDWIEPFIPTAWKAGQLEENSNFFYDEITRLLQTHPFAIVFGTALVAPLAEELMFRGFIQQTVKHFTRSWHIGIWVAALLFALIHFNWAGFVPRFLLGALLGYFAYWGNSLWPAIVAHGLFNSFSLILSAGGVSDAQVTETFSSPWLAMASLWIGVAALIVMRKLFLREQLSELLKNAGGND